MTEQKDLMLRASYATGSVDSRILCDNAEKWIKKYGGSKQRSEGIRLLKRIKTRIYETAMQPLQELDKKETL